MAAAFVGALSSTAASSTEKTLHAFRGGSDGEYPGGSLIADVSGNLYGTTGEGGGGTGCDEYSYGCGTVFELSPKGRETVLYAFAGGSDGAGANPGLVADSAGNLYGTTYTGGGSGFGTVFKLTPEGTESVFYAFQGSSDGSNPEGSLIADTSANLYVETEFGGSYNGSVCDVDGCGTVFEVQPDGTKTTLYSFQAEGGGVNPTGGVIVDSAGTLYGTTAGGGGSGCHGEGCGTVFEVPANGTESVLYAFQGGADGVDPEGGVTMDSAGNLYGTTLAGGNCTFYPFANDCGTVFKLAPDGTKTVLYNFQGGKDGLWPWAPLIIDTKGNLYGTTYYGGSSQCAQEPAPRGHGYGCGTVYKVTPDGKETVLYAFVARKNGAFLMSGGLFLGAHHEIDGAAPTGGKHDYGVIFEVKE